ncbi:MAG: hypothetical protein ABIK53_07820 [bacterium]|nr:hypothetical protein [Candidatus Omnitrophota bacterium]
MITSVEFVIEFDETCKLRERFIKSRGTILRFSVQLETIVGGTSAPIRRYDTAHGFFHCDIIHADGKINKQPIPATNFNEALTIAEYDLRQFWKTYRDEFLKEVENYGNK